MAALIEMTRAELAGSLEFEVQAFLREAFSHDPPAEPDYYAPYEPSEMILLLREDRPEEQRVIGHLVAYRREITIGGEPVEIGMIGGVAVAPGHRRKGHARVLIERIHDRFRQRALPFSLLFAYEPRIYASSGYRPMENTTYFLDSDGAWKTFVYRGGMYAELGNRRWPNLPIDLRGRAV
jgi:GNAT superfamily N-acetyltransferase